MILVILIFLMGYVKAPPDVAYIISGLRKHPKVLIGKAGIKIPFLERVDKLIVRQISIDIKSEGYIPTQDFIGVDVDAVAKVRVMTDPEGIQLAMKNFLNMTEDDFNRAIVDSLQGNMREIIGTITLKEICNDRKKFGDEVQSKAQTDMNALGIQIISCNIQRVTDENSLINSLGQDNMSKIQKDAAIAKAEAERDIAIAQAQAAKASNDAQVEADMHIAQKQNDLAIKQSELKVQEDTKRAEADAAYTIQQQEQQRSIETATVNAQIAKTEREAELKSKEVEVKKQSLDAEVRAAADADRYRKEQEAQAALYQRQKDAEAVRYEQEQAAGFFDDGACLLGHGFRLLVDVAHQAARAAVDVVQHVLLAGPDVFQRVHRGRRVGFGGGAGSGLLVLGLFVFLGVCLAVGFLGRFISQGAGRADERGRLPAAVSGEDRRKAEDGQQHEDRQGTEQATVHGPPQGKAPAGEGRGIMALKSQQ